MQLNRGRKGRRNNLALIEYIPEAMTCRVVQLNDPTLDLEYLGRVELVPSKVNKSNVSPL